MIHTMLLMHALPTGRSVLQISTVLAPFSALQMILNPARKVSQQSHESSLLKTMQTHLRSVLHQQICSVELTCRTAYWPACHPIHSKSSTCERSFFSCPYIGLVDKLFNKLMTGHADSILLKQEVYIQRLNNTSWRVNLISSCLKLSSQSYWPE